MMNREDAIQLVWNERDYQNEKWGREDGGWNDHILKKLAILTEEFGEVAKAINEEQWSEVKQELVDVAAVCISWLEADFR